MYAPPAGDLLRWPRVALGNTSRACCHHSGADPSGACSRVAAGRAGRPSSLCALCDKSQLVLLGRGCPGHQGSAAVRQLRSWARSRNLWVRWRRTTADRKECGSRLRRVARPRGKSPARCGAPPRASATVSSGRSPGAHGCGKGASKVAKSQLARPSVQIFMQP